jgi:putative transposase
MKLLDRDGRNALVTPVNSEITVKRQAELMEVNRTSVYRKPKPNEYSAADLHLMRLIDKIHTAHPTWGYRTITKVIRRDEGIKVNKKKVRRLMKVMGVHTIFPQPNLSKRYSAQYRRPYLLRNLVIDEPDQVWGADITYIRMGRGFMYLFIIIDWYSRCIVDYELSTTLTKDFVLGCCRRALERKVPSIFNTDQGSHFTNPDYLALMDEFGVRVSMDGKGQALDNVRTERFFRTLKYDLIYTQEFYTPRALRKALREYMNEYNTYRPHSSIGDRCPADVYGIDRLLAA